MPRSTQDDNGREPGDGRQQEPDLEELLKAKRRRLKPRLPGAMGIPGWLPITAALLLAAVVATFAFTFRVDTDEVGVVMRFGKVTRQEPPGLHLRLPYPIDEVHLPKVMRQNLIEIGLPTRGGSGSVREQELMLTGDENIVDVRFVVLWRIEDAIQYLFNMRNPDATVEEVAKSAMSEVVGRSGLQPILTAARQSTEQEVRKLMQDMLDRYGAGIRVDRVRLLKVDPPTQVVDSFRDVQAAAIDKETVQNQALAYAGRIVAEARGEAEAIMLRAKGYREQTVAEAAGQSARFEKVLGEYTKAPGVTRTRLYLETMERVFGGADKIIIDSSGVVSFLSLAPRPKR
jgi:modulator of FtsH protease HflK